MNKKTNIPIGGAWGGMGVWRRFLLSIGCALVFFIPPFGGQAQNTSNGTTEFSIETTGSASSGKFTPFWIVSNKYGVIPLEANNAFLRVGLFHRQSYGNGLQWSAGLDALTVTPRYNNLYVQQLYAAIQYKCLHLTVGSYENYTSLWDKELSSGDLVHSPNARPIPEINLSVPSFTTIPFTKKRLQYRGNISVGRSFDSQYLQQIINDKEFYINNILWHTKFLQLRLIDLENKFPLTAVLGLHHAAQWGGVSTNPTIGKLPQSFKDLIRIILGSEGGADAGLGDQINALGNHYGSYDLQFGYLHNAFSVYLYWQHFFDDHSGMEFRNAADGLWGLQVELPNFAWFNKIVVEYVDSRNQSGPIHHIQFDHDRYPGYGGGNDDYYNHGVLRDGYSYTGGVSYFNRGIGPPLITSPEYNENGCLGFQNNRIRAFHIGFQGYLSKQISYRLLSTFAEGWGTMTAPFLKKKDTFSCAAKISWRPPRLADWLFTSEVATDIGSMYARNAGIAISIKKTGLINR